MVAADMADAKAQFADAMGRDRADRGLGPAAQAAKEAVRGLAAYGPARLVAAELARLDREAAQAERRADRWEQTAASLARLRAAHRAQADNAAAELRQAEADGAAFLAAVAVEAVAHARLAIAGRLARRRANTEHQAAVSAADAARERVLSSWGGLPGNAEALPARTADPRRHARDYRTQAAAARKRAAELRSLPVRDAAALIETERAATGRAEQAQIERAKRLTRQTGPAPNAHGPRPSGPGLAL
ncbi:MAG: hypothetical protein LBJ08_12115 [Bifidobacteriaceae bacterium]|nr:hypothetical protein [Bifidobacteriaceae bacterium]